jgi:molybdate transport system substrate-binding protein
MRRVVLLFLICSFALGDRAQTLTVMTSGGFAGAYKQLAPRFEARSSIHLTFVGGPSMGNTPAAIPVRLAHGQAADVVILARASLDTLVKQGLVVKGSQVDLVRSRIGIAVRAGSPIPDISNVDSFRRTLVAAKSIAYSDSASGEYIIHELYKKLGIEAEATAKSWQIRATPVGEIIARGEAEIGFQQLSELKPVKGITLVGPIPEAVQSVTTFAAGIVTNSKHPEQARQLIRYLAQPSSCEAIRVNMLEPIACSDASKNSGHR